MSRSMEKEGTLRERYGDSTSDSTKRLMLEHNSWGCDSVNKNPARSINMKVVCFLGIIFWNWIVSSWFLEYSPQIINVFAVICWWERQREWQLSYYFTAKISWKIWWIYHYTDIHHIDTLKYTFFKCCSVNSILRMNPRKYLITDGWCNRAISFAKYV